MYTAQFSEFSYGYAMTDNILHSGLPRSPYAPIFPSLFAEGTAGGGYDVQIPLHPIAIFLQFKIPQIVHRRSAKMPSGFSIPYLRMHLRTKHPNQHQLLLDLENTGNLVYYAFPEFWTTERLDEFFMLQNVHENSLYLPPTSIGVLDDKSHHVAYQPGNSTIWIRSKPNRLEGQFGAQNFADDVEEAVKKAGPQKSISFLLQIKDTISKIISGEKIDLGPEIKETLSVLHSRENEKSLEFEELSTEEESEETRRFISIARTTAYLSQVHLGCNLIITGVN